MLSSHVNAQDPIDLVNVAFAHPASRQGHSESKSVLAFTFVVIQILSNKFSLLAFISLYDFFSLLLFSYQVPDRITGLAALEELKLLCPGRQWHFIEVWAFSLNSYKRVQWYNVEQNRYLCITKFV